MGIRYGLKTDASESVRDGLPSLLTDGSQLDTVHSGLSGP